MEIQVDVDVILPAKVDRLVDRLQGALVDAHPIFAVGPRPVGKGQAGEVEAPSRDPREVGFVEGLVAKAASQLGKIETAPAWNAWLRD
jgi:hypothetical protein